MLAAELVTGCSIRHRRWPRSCADTVPRIRANSRVKDLVDMALLIESGGMDKLRIMDALRLTLNRRESHELPADLRPPPAKWQIPFQALAEECKLPADAAEVFAGVSKYFQEVLNSSGPLRIDFQP